MAAPRARLRGRAALALSEVELRASSCRALLLVLVGAVLTVLAGLATLFLGVVPVPAHAVVRALGDLVGLPGHSAAPDFMLVVDMRLPRAVGAITAGAALGASGCMLQALLRNPLASPFVIGAAQAAGFGALLAILLGWPYMPMLAIAFGMSVFAAWLVLSLARSRQSLPTESVVLTGISVSLFFFALQGLLRFLAHDRGVLARMALWVQGGLWDAAWVSLRFLAPLTVIAVVATMFLARRLDLLALGQEDAQRLGVSVRRTGTLALLLACLLASLAVCTAGVLAFVGLIVPHAARRLVGPGHAVLLPASAFLGSLLVLATDSVARTALPPQEIPLSVVTSLFGVPAFLVLMRSLRARRSS